MDFFPGLDVSALQAEAIGRGLYAVALADGAHAEELAVITDFYRAASEWPRANASTLAQMGPLEPKYVAQLLVGSEHRELFVRAAFLTAWSDDQVSAAARAKIGDFAEALQIPLAVQRVLEAQAKELLRRAAPYAKTGRWLLANFPNPTQHSV